ATPAGPPCPTSPPAANGTRPAPPATGIPRNRPRTSPPAPRATGATIPPAATPTPAATGATPATIRAPAGAGSPSIGLLYIRPDHPAPRSGIPLPESRGGTASECVMRVSQQVGSFDRIERSARPGFDRAQSP